MHTSIETHTSTNLQYCPIPYGLLSSAGHMSHNPGLQTLAWLTNLVQVPHDRALVSSTCSELGLSAKLERPGRKVLWSAEAYSPASLWEDSRGSVHSYSGYTSGLHAQPCWHTNGWGDTNTQTLSLSLSLSLTHTHIYFILMFMLHVGYIYLMS